MADQISIVSVSFELPAIIQSFYAFVLISFHRYKLRENTEPFLNCAV